MVAVLLCAGCREAVENPEVGLEEMGYEVTADGFHRAAEIGDVAVMGRMLEAGMEVGVLDGEGNTALHAAAAVGSEAGVRYLVEQGIEVDVRGARERTPLMLAAEADEAGSLRELMRLGAKPELVDVDGYRALTMAADVGSAEAVEALAVSSRPFLDDAMLLACLRGHSGCVALLADYGASVYARMDDGSTPLMLAAREGHVGVVEVLLERGANRFAVDDEERTAGQIAEEGGHVELAARLNAEPGEDAFLLPEIAGMEEEEGALLGAVGGAIIGGALGGAAGFVAGEDGEGADFEEGGGIAVPGVVRPGGAPVDAGEQSVDVSGETVEAVVTGGLRSGDQTVTLGNPGREAVGEASVLVMERYEEKPLPLRVEGVDESGVRVRYLYGENKQVTVKEGEVIPLTGLRVVSVVQRRDHSKVTNGVPADVSVVEVEDPETGQRRKLTVKLGASAHEPFAMLRAGKEGVPVMVRRGMVMRGADGQSYRVMDVRPAQVVVENVESGQVKTLKLQKN